jgi:drug/metabolite transporter (DMT)-like permease
LADTQSYANHAHRTWGWIVTALCAVLGFAGMVLFVVRQPSVLTVCLLLLAAAVVGLATLIRRYTTRLQDRIIRLEMRVRLMALGREHDMARLTMRQVVALRFASDAELAALIDRALGENLTPDQIKRAVTNWQADRMRT